MRRLLFALLTVGVLLASLPAFDHFTGADGTALATYSANWTVVQGSFSLLTNSVTPGSALVHGYAAWNADLPNPDQYAQLVITPVAGTAIGVALRGSLVAMTNYMCRADGVNIGIEGWNAGAYLGAPAGAAFVTVAGDVLRCEAVGTTLRMKIIRAGVTVANISGTDATLTSGYAGLSSYNAGAALGDDFEVGNMPVTTRKAIIFTK